MSAFTMSLTSASKLVLCRHPSLALALLESPRRKSTSVGPKIARIDLYQRLSGRLVEALLLDAASVPDDRPADMSKGLFDEFTHRVCLAGGKNIIVWLVLLQDQPHSFDKIARVAPVAHCVEIPEKQLLL